ncbi:hypothetical protein Tco_1460915, partial [Tanacetum coccineum]
MGSLMVTAGMEEFRDCLCKIEAVDLVMLFLCFLLCLKLQVTLRAFEKADVCSKGDLAGIQETVRDEELFLKQRSKVHWLSEGDHNTKYFHRAMKEKRNSNRIEFVEDLDGNFYSGEDVGEQFIKYFEGVLGRRVVVDPVIDPSSLFSNKLYQRDTEFMVRPVSHEEIKAALFSMEDDKAPGPDGFSSKFFKASWSVVGPEFTKAIQDYFSITSILCLFTFFFLNFFSLFLLLAIFFSFLSSYFFLFLSLYTSSFSFSIPLSFLLLLLSLLYSLFFLYSLSIRFFTLHGLLLVLNLLKPFKTTSPM